MVKLNAELIAIRDSLRCGHCSSAFVGSDSQAWKVKYERRTVYCSTACRHAALAKKFSTPVPERGPCPTCGQRFASRTAKTFCSLKCYVASPQFAEIGAVARVKASTRESIEKRAAIARKGVVAQCLDCGEEFYQKRASANRSPKLFCGRPCYRAYFSKRFDRWIADPHGMQLPQNYDEFLDNEVLRCLVEGCNWRGKFLSTHVNYAHGVKAEEFKRAAGFNLSTGLVSKDVAQVMSERRLVGVAASGGKFPNAQTVSLAIEAQQREGYVRYQSVEGCEHKSKAMAMLAASVGPERICRQCQAQFTQPTPLGRQFYCSTKCRNSYYAEQARGGPPKVRTRGPDGRIIWKSPADAEARSTK
jgi:hypothetical protein